MPDFLKHPVFQAAQADIEALGVRIHAEPKLGAVPYAVIGGRSNARWWLVPLLNGKTAASGLAMFQPTLASARWLKRAAVLCSRLGLTRLWAKPTVYVIGRPSIAERFGRDDLCFAYFTGTDSPHRKAAVQVMNVQGNILGFAKVSRNPAVKALLRHEAEMLAKVQALDLRSAIVPKVLYIGQALDAEVLVTDTLKTARTSTTLSFTAAHRAFLDELACKTSAGKISAQALGTSYRERFNAVAGRLDEHWRVKLDHAINRLEWDKDTQFFLAMAHGDFTPWNTFMVGSKLYVFDWEYASSLMPVHIDCYSFILSLGKYRYLAEYSLLKTKYISKKYGSQSFTNLTTVVLLEKKFRQIERSLDFNKVIQWDSSDLSANYFDALIKNECK